MQIPGGGNLHLQVRMLNGCTPPFFRGDAGLNGFISLLKKTNKFHFLGEFLNYLLPQGFDTPLSKSSSEVVEPHSPQRWPTFPNCQLPLNFNQFQFYNPRERQNPDRNLTMKCNDLWEEITDSTVRRTDAIFHPGSAPSSPAWICNNLLTRLAFLLTNNSCMFTLL